MSHKLRIEIQICRKNYDLKMEKVSLVSHTHLQTEEADVWLWHQLQLLWSKALDLFHQSVHVSPWSSIKSSLWTSQPPKTHFHHVTWTYFTSRRPLLLACMRHVSCLRKTGLSSAEVNPGWPPLAQAVAEWVSLGGAAVFSKKTPMQVASPETRARRSSGFFFLCFFFVVILAHKWIAVVVA